MSNGTYRKSGSGFTKALLMLPVMAILAHSGFGGIANAAQHAIQSGMSSAMSGPSFGGAVFASNTVSGGSAIYVSGGPIYLR